MFSCYGKQFCHLVYALTGIDAWQGDKRLPTAESLVSRTTERIGSPSDGRIYSVTGKILDSISIPKIKLV
jgi:GTP cyclohydrolase II